MKVYLLGSNASNLIWPWNYIAEVIGLARKGISPPTFASATLFITDSMESGILEIRLNTLE
jgi:hypothetical protein